MTGGPSPLGAPSTFREDIQGLRAVAVALVVAYHLWPDTVTGGYVGVDVFFVISGFLITSHLLAHPPQTGRDLAGFWARRIRRLLPAAFLVLAVTLVAARLVAPATQWGAIATEVIASALYVQNWALAGSSVDYLGAESAPTPTQHFWSLSVEEQFYLFWPFLILGAFWLTTRLRLRWTVAARWAIAAVIAASLAASIVLTANEPASAYFVTPTRIWELAVGGALATFRPLDAERVPAGVASALAWVGLAMVVVAGVAFSGATPFPGSAALLPVLGTALVIYAAAPRRGSPTAVLGVRPVQHVGDVSYSIYLWHWPLIALAPYVAGQRGWLESIAIIALTIALATVTKRLVEDPVRFGHRLQPLVPTYRLAAAGMIVVTAAAGLQLVEFDRRAESANVQRASVEARIDAQITSGGEGCLGAAAIARGFDICPPDPAGAMVPEPTVAKDDKSDAYADDCWTGSPYTARKICHYGRGSTRVALVGNSHAGQWLPALEALAEQKGWSITTYLVSQCNVMDAPLQFDTAEKTANCRAYARWAMDQTTRGQFDLIVTAERQSVPLQGKSIEASVGPAAASYAATLAEWTRAGASVLVLRDIPYPGRTVKSVPDCLAQHPSDQAACSGTPTSWAWPDPLFDAASHGPMAGVRTFDSWRWFCTATTCPAVIGGVVTYFDASHMTATYAKTLVPYLAGPLDDALAN